MGDINTLSPEEAKYFDTRGSEAPPPPEKVEEKQPDLLEQVEKPEAEQVEKVEAKEPEKKSPPEIEVVEDDDGEGEPDARKYVKVGVLRREREEKKAARIQAQQAAQRAAELERQIQALKAPPREVAPEEAGQVALERLQQIEAMSQEAQAKANFVRNWQRTAQEFAKEQTDFADAYKHALDARRGIYEDAGFAPEQVNVLLESEEASIVERALIAGKNPAKVLYDIAVKRFGYQVKAKEAEAKKPEADAVKNAEKLAKIQEGMNRNKAPSGGGGGESAPTLQEMAEMDDAEFDKLAGDPKAWKKMMGG